MIGIQGSFHFENRRWKKSKDFQSFFSVLINRLSNSVIKWSSIGIVSTRLKYSVAEEAGGFDRCVCLNISLGSEDSTFTLEASKQASSNQVEWNSSTFALASLIVSFTELMFSTALTMSCHLPCSFMLSPLV